MISDWGLIIIKICLVSLDVDGCRDQTNRIMIPACIQYEVEDRAGTDYD